MLKILITGCEGMLGSSLNEYFLRRNYSVLGTDIENMDIRDKSQVNHMFSDFRPDIVFHLAALTNLEDCEKQPDIAFEVNTYGTGNLVEACNLFGSKLVYVSTGAVFDGTKKESYKETDKPNPKSVYGKSKYLGEQIIVHKSKDYLIARTGWLFGSFKRDKKFVGKIFRMLMGKTKRISAIKDTLGSPTFTNDLAKSLEILLGENGIYHITNQGCATRYDIAKIIINATGMENVELCSISLGDIKQQYSVLRIPNETLDITKLLGKNSQIIRTWEDALAQYISEYKTRIENGTNE